MPVAWTHAIQQSKALWALLLVLLLSLLTYNSNGIMRGGDDDDEGSGLGGTGRSLNKLREPGVGSGLGGTGFRPYLGVNSSDASKPAELVIVDRPLPRTINGDHSDPALPTAIAASRSGIQLEQSLTPAQRSTPIASEARATNPLQITRDSSAISIEESIQWELDNQVLTLESARHLVADSRASATDSPVNIYEGAREEPVQGMEQQNPLSETAPDVETDEFSRHGKSDHAATISWASLVEELEKQPDTDPNILADNTDSPDQDAEIMQRPERVQRPALPPVQRIRPVQRAGLLPPRIRPLQL